VTIFNSVGSPGTLSLASGGNILAFNNLNTTPAQVLAGDPARTSIVFHNPGTIDIFVAPGFVQNTGSDVALVPSTAALGGCYRVYANGGSLTISGECQKPWQAFSASATNNPLTIQVSRI
jgi:hypothetical protein